MRQFTGTHDNRLDAKGRVSVPAPFRAILRAGLAADAPVTFVLRPSHRHACVECWPQERYEVLSHSLDGLDPLGEEYDFRSASIFGGSTPIDMDKEGRIVLTPVMAEKAQVSDRVTFLGRGGTFELWEPDAARTYLGASTERMRAASQPVRPSA